MDGRPVQDSVSHYNIYDEAERLKHDIGRSDGSALWAVCTLLEGATPFRWAAPAR